MTPQWKGGHAVSRARYEAKIRERQIAEHEAELRTKRPWVLEALTPTLAADARDPAELLPLERMAIHEALQTLSYREARILELLYGLGGERQNSHQQVAFAWRLPVPRIRQIEAQALKRLQSLPELWAFRDESYRRTRRLGHYRTKSVLRKVDGEWQTFTERVPA